MANLVDNIKDYVLGTPQAINRVVDDLPDGLTVDKAVLCIKISPNGADPLDENALVRKEITPVASAHGVVTDPGSGAEPDRTATLDFLLTAEDTRPLSVFMTYYWGVLAVLSNGVERPVSRGTFRGTHSPVNSSA